MSTQSYYKDRLGFDPREELYDGQPSSRSSTVKSGSRSRTVHHYYSSSSNGGVTGVTSNVTAVVGGVTGVVGGATGVNSSSRVDRVDSVDRYDYHSSSPSKKQRQSPSINNNNNTINQGDGYEDALTQFKGMMSLWDYFVENWDITGRKVTLRKRMQIEWILSF